MLLLLWLSNADAGAYHFGGSCVSQGAWTRSAFEFGRHIREAVEQVADDPNCKGLARAFTQIPMPKDDPPPNGQREDQDARPENAEANNANLAAVNGVLRSDPNSRPDLLAQLMGSLLARSGWEFLYGGDQHQKDRQRYIRATLSGLNNLFSNLPSYSRCLINSPAAATTLISGAVRTLAAFAGSGETNLSGLGETIRHFTDFLRDQRTANVLATLDQAELSMAISCLAETASENYCKVKDAYELLKYAEAMKSNVRLQSASNKDQNLNPTEGYFIISREIPIVTSWMQRVLIGVRPRMLSDASFKNKVLDNINDFLQAQNLAYGSYSQAALRYKALTDDQARKNLLYDEIAELDEILVGVKYHYGGVRGDVNFVDQAIQRIRVPYFLIGIEELPPEVLPNKDGKVVMEKWAYILNGGKYLEQFNDPDHLLETIGKQLDVMLNKASKNASAYFQQQLIVDMPNLVDQALVSPTISVYEALVHIDDYLTKLIERAESSDSELELGILPNMVRTRSNAETVIEKFHALFKASRAQVDRLKSTSGPERSEVRKQIEQAFLRDEYKDLLGDVISALYVTFNMMLQRDTFLLNRMTTYVNYDYSYYVRNPDLMTKYQRDLLIVSANDLLGLLASAYESNPSAVALDLQGAQTINLVNLRALELFFRDKMMHSIARFKLIAEGYGDSYFTQKWDSIRRWWRDSQLDTEKLYSSLIWTDPYVVADPIALIYRWIMNPERYRVTGPIFEQATIERDDMYGSVDQVKAKLCLQTLSYSNYYEYHYLCHGSVLKSWILDPAEGRPLEQNYESLYRTYAIAAIRGQHASRDSEEFRHQQELFDNNVCAVRDYRRRNFVEWLTRQISPLNK